ncbi:MAG: hypothetical protein CBARDCOR_6944 [uncultured Caballeronia sp.]|nr:MAG: hypothetical protein CBARDCOR_6944 [uncultured Caballeronia sp.]
MLSTRRHTKPRSLFDRNLLLFLVLSTVGHVTTLTVYTMLLLPQAKEVGKLTAWQINTLDVALSHISGAASI